MKFQIFLLVGVFWACKKKSQDDDQEVLARWKPAFSPYLFSNYLVAHLENLPLSGSVEQEPYPGYYWPLNEASLSQRWREYFVFGNNQNSFSFSFGKIDQLNNLSPAEKYDLYRGQTRFPLSHHERRRSFPTAQHWEGLCHGQGPAALNFREPKSVQTKLADGREITFFSSDIKGLLAYAQAYHPGGPIEVLGSPCTQDFSSYEDLKKHPECSDINPAAFHLILAYEIGVKKQGFVADLNNGPEIWNYPLKSYEIELKDSRVPSSDAARGTEKEVHVHLVLHAAEFLDPKDTPYLPNYQGSFPFETDYWLEIDQAGRILGGSWFPDAPEIDSLWRQPPPVFQGELEPLGELYRLSTQ
jgi:hypothetical protein